MAEKEERIRVLIAKNPCKECSVKKCTRKCMFGLLFEKAPGITRTDAIERMAKAIDKLGLDMDAIDSYICAESALNALLEGK